MGKFIKIAVAVFIMLFSSIAVNADTEIPVEPEGEEFPTDESGKTSPIKVRKKIPCVIYRSEGVVSVRNNSGSSYVYLSIHDDSDHDLFNDVQIPVAGITSFKVGELENGRIYIIHVCCDGIWWKGAFVAE